MIPNESGWQPGHAPTARSLGMLDPMHEGPAAVIQGTLLWTADGEIPVEYLTPGDRVITRLGGLQRIAAIESLTAVVARVRVAAGALGKTLPDVPITLLATQAVRLGGRRTGPPRTVRAGDLVAERLAFDLGTGPAMIFHIHLAQADTLYAGGLELISAPT